jgi:hypothetical protein
MVLNNLIHTDSYSASSRHHYSIAAYFYLHLRRNLPYASFSPPRRIAPAESIHQAGEFQQVRDAEQRPLPAQDDLGIGSNNVPPLRPNRANSPLVGLQQQSDPIAVVPLPYAE